MAPSVYIYLALVVLTSAQPSIRSIKAKAFTVAVSPHDQVRASSSLIRRDSMSKQKRTLEEPAIEAYVISDKCEGKSLSDKLTTLFAGVHCSPPTYVRPGEIQLMLKNGSLDVSYSSFDVPHLPKTDVEKAPRLTHDVGAALAHQQVWRNFLQCAKSGMCGTFAMVFEDDAIVRDDFTDILNGLRSKLPEISAEMVLVGHCFESCPVAPEEGIDIGSGAKLVDSRHGLCNHGYLISVEGASRLLNVTTSIKHAADEQILNAYRGKQLRSLSVCPSAVSQEGRTWAGRNTTKAEGNLSKWVLRRLQGLCKKFKFDKVIESKLFRVVHQADRWQRPNFVKQAAALLEASKDPAATVLRLLARLDELTRPGHGLNSTAAVWKR